MTHLKVTVVGFMALGLTSILISCRSTNLVKYIGHFGAHDSPIIIRGGSIKAHRRANSTVSDPQVVPNTNGLEYQFATNKVLNTVSTEGTAVYPASGTYHRGDSITLSDVVPSTTTTNWMISIFFRDNQGNDAPGSGAELDLCSDVNCSTSGDLSATSKLLYMRTNAAGAITQETLETAGLRFHVGSCPSISTGTDTPCDHPSKVTIVGFPGVTTPNLLCVDGNCVIGVDHTKP